MPGVFCQLLSQAGAKYVFHKLCVRMKMTRLTLLPLLCILFFGCTENKKAETITYKDIEGYWVSGYLLHNTDLSRSIAAGNAEKEQGIQLLRLKNEVNGFADTSYRINGNILSYRVKNGYSNLAQADSDLILFEREPEVFNEFQIVFHSKDRLILRDKESQKEITYYNLKMVPEEKQSIESITFSDIRMKFQQGKTDSAFIGLRSAANNIFRLHQIKTDKKWVSELNSIAGSINWKGALFFEESNKEASPKLDIQDSIMYIIPPARSSYHSVIPFQLKTNKFRGIWYVGVSSDPALNALMFEMDVWKFYCYKHKILDLVIVECGTGLPDPDYINGGEEYVKP
jgi:hypothetical protein